MASFTNCQADWSRLDYAILRDGHGVALFRQRQFFDESIERLLKEGHELKRFDCAKWSAKRDFIGAIASGLGLPPGLNLDSLSDGLSELKIHSQVGLTLAFESFDTFAATDRYVADTFVDILIETSLLHLLFGNRLISVFLCEDSTYLPELPKPRAFVDPVQVVGIFGGRGRT